MMSVTQKPSTSIPASWGLSRIAVTSKPCIVCSRSGVAGGRRRLRGRKSARYLEGRCNLKVADIDGYRGGNRKSDCIGDIRGLWKLISFDEPFVGVCRGAMDMRENIRGDTARTNLGHAHAPPEGVDAQLARQHADGGLGCMIGGVSAEIVGARDRADIDHVASIAGGHSRDDQATQMQDGAQVDVD